MKERFKCLIAVFLLLTRENNGETEILLQKRKNTGYMDGKYDLSSSGHLEQNESLKQALARETKEEIGIDINENDLELVNIFHENQSDISTEYLMVTFRTNKYVGTPTIMEPNKNEELLWVNINNIPENVIYSRKMMIDAIINNRNYIDRAF
jgi:8-oxo-dGTP pyrophosphatase MutT (NUDIX family)